MSNELIYLASPYSHDDEMVRLHRFEQVDCWGFRTIERTHERPNYFYYAVPENLIQPHEIPDYAGLLYVREHVEGPELYYRIVSEVKAPTRLHREKITERQLWQLVRATNRRYWKQRIGLLKLPMMKEAGQ